MADPIDFQDLNWLQLATLLKRDCRVVVPLGATEQHGYLSLATDSLVVDRITAEACRRTGVVRAPVFPLGCSAFAANFPGTLSLRSESFCRVIEDIVDSLYRQGFRRVNFVTGHGGNEVITGVLAETMLCRPNLSIRYMDACEGMKNRLGEIAAARDLPKPAHADWHEVFDFTKVSDIPEKIAHFPDSPDFPPFPLNPRNARHYLGDGVEVGPYDLGDSALMESLLEDAISYLASILGSQPKSPPST